MKQVIRTVSVMMIFAAGSAQATVLRSYRNWTVTVGDKVFGIEEYKSVSDHTVLHYGVGRVDIGVSFLGIVGPAAVITLLLLYLGVAIGIRRRRIHSSR
jgi:hypothetical protein